MSYTELYKFKRSGKITCFAEVRNAYRGAAAIWNIIDKKYLPPYIPSWATDFNNGGYSRMGEMSEMGKIWSLFDNKELPETDRIVLGSTFDFVVVLRKDIPHLLLAFREFSGETSLKEQADLIEAELKKDKNFIAIAWNQTSVNGDTWMSENSKSNGERGEYNMKKESKHFNLFDDLKK